MSMPVDNDLNISQISINIPDDPAYDGVDWTELAGGEVYQKLRGFQRDFELIVNRALTQATLHAVEGGATIETALQFQEKAIRNALDVTLHAALAREHLLER